MDRSEESGQVVTTGPQTYQLMRGVSESLAGRIGILEMSGLSLRDAWPNLPRGVRAWGACGRGAGRAPAGLDLLDLRACVSMPRSQDAPSEWNGATPKLRALLERACAAH